MMNVEKWKKDLDMARRIKMNYLIVVILNHL